MGFNPLNVIKGIAGVVGDVIGMGGGDLASGVTSAKMARTAYQHRYQDTVRDMRKAGLNPALAYGENPGSGAPNQGLPELGSSFARGRQALSNAQQSAATADLVGAQAALLKAQGADLIDQVRLRNELTQQEIGKTVEETKLTSARTATETQRPRLVRLAYDRALMDYQWQSATWDTRISILDKQLRQAGLNLSRSEIENELLRLSKPQAQAEAKFYEGAGQYSPYVNSALDIIKALMPKVNFGGKTIIQAPRRIGK